MAEPFDVVIHHNPDCGTPRNVVAMAEAAGDKPVILLLAGSGRPHLEQASSFEGATMPVTPFLYLVVDHDTRTFSVEGPMTDDRPWDKAVIAAKDAGRDVQCGGSGGGSLDKDKLAESYVQSFRYTRVPAGSILTPDRGEN